MIWLRGLNPWSPESGGALTLTHADIVEQIVTLPDASVDGTPFPALKGRLSLPVRGDVEGQFGSPRAGGDRGDRIAVGDPGRHSRPLPGGRHADPAANTDRCRDPERRLRIS